MKKVTVFSPASVANVSCGYDILGLALDNIGDEITLEKREDDKIEITKIDGASLPMEPDNNIVGVCLKAFLKKLKSKQGFNIELIKRVKPGSGLGSSASSASGIVYAANEILGRPFNTLELVDLGMVGEAFVSGKKHADNVAPSLMGGFTCIRSYSPLDIFEIPGPDDLYVTIAHPQIEIKTLDSKKILRREVSIEDVITQTGNIAGFICGLNTKNYSLISRSMVDVIAEPVRSMLIPQYANAKNSALENGALGFNISGSGPSVFALCRGEKVAERVSNGLKSVYEKSDFHVNHYISKISNKGARIINSQ